MEIMGQWECMGSWSNGDYGAMRIGEWADGAVGNGDDGTMGNEDDGATRQQTTFGVTLFLFRGFTFWGKF